MNGRSSARGVPFDGRSLVELLRFRAAAQPHERAYTFLESGEVETGAWTWGELDERARAIASWLQSHLVAGDRALLLYPPGLDFIAGFFGCLYAGVIAVPALPPQRQSGRGRDRLESIVRSASPRAVLTAGGPIRHFAGAVAPDVTVGATDEIGLHAAEAWQAPPVDRETLAFLQYTSGSTAAPKGVMVSHANLLDNLSYGFEAGESGPDTASVSWLPVTHDMGLIEGVLQPAYSGTPAWLMSPAAFLQRPLRWLQTISRVRATRSGGPNFAYELAASRISREERACLDLSCWRAAYNGAEPVRYETLEAFSAAFASSGFVAPAFRPCYGLAEATLLVCSERWTPNDEESPVSCGRPARGTRVLIVDPVTGSVCADGQPGEIVVAGGGVARGYWNDEEETSRVFASNAGSSERRLRTGDIGFVRGGRLFVTGRLKDLLIVRGAKIFPQDLEHTVEMLSGGVRRGGVTAVAVGSGIRGDHVLVVAEIDPRIARDSTRDGLISRIREGIALQHGISLHAVALLAPGTLPKTTSGKPRRYLCREGWLQGTLASLNEWCEGQRPVIAAVPVNVCET